MSLIADIHADLENGAVRLIAEYRTRLFADAVQLCGNSTDAEDLVSRTFQKVLSRIDQHRPDGDFYGWMKAILTNIHRDDLDRPVTRGTVAVDAATLERCAGADTSTDDQILANSDRDALREAINQLDPEYRQAVAMYYFNELSLKEIAAFLNSSTSSVSRKLEVARKILAAKLETKLGKKPLAALLAALLGVGALFGAWQTGLLEQFLSQSGEAYPPSEASCEAGAMRGESFPLQEETFQGGEAVASGEAESFPLQEETTSTQLQPQPETDLTQDESQSETKEEQTMNLKTVKAVAASAAMLAGTLGASAEERAYWTYDATAKTISDGVWVLGVTESNGKLTITGPKAETVYTSDMTLDLAKPVEGGKTITAIGGNALDGYGKTLGTSLTALKLPETLETLANAAIARCSKLLTITPFLPASVTSIGNMAFWNSSALTGDIVLGQEDGVLTLSGTQGFVGTKITSVTINADISGGTLPGSIFNGCSSLTNVVLRGNVTTLSSSAFGSCTKLADFYVSSFVTSWPADAISGPAAYKMRLWVDKSNPDWKNWVADDTKVLSWDGLDAVTKAKYDENFGTDAPRPVGLVTGDGVQPASQWVMLWDKGGEPVLWPMEVKATGYEGLVDGQPHNITVTVTKPVGGIGCSYEWSLDGGETWSDEPPNLTAAGTYTVNCRVSAEGFESAEVSATVILHGAANDHWTYDSSAKTITDGVWVINVTDSKGELTLGRPTTGTDYRPNMTLDLAKPVEGGKTIVAIGSNSFDGYGNPLSANLTTVILPDTLKTLANAAFARCPNLRTVTPFLPVSVTAVGQQAFWGSSLLAGDLVLGQKGATLSLTGMLDFSGTKITSATIDAELKDGTLPTSIFSGCSSLTNVVLRAGVTTISASAFASCTKLSDLYLGAYVTSWADSAFSGATSEYGMRLWVDAYGKEWNDWVAANVTPWNKLDGDVQGTFYDNFGANAKRPVGLIAASSAQLPLQWLARWYPNGPKKGFMVILQ